jgi:multiple sugar transport system ATP-binding protein
MPRPGIRAQEKEEAMAKVVLEHVYKIYPGDVTAVHDANLEIEDREFVVLVGPSGCGKSTTLRMVAGLEEISKGAVYIDGKKVNDVPPKDRDIAMVFQNYALYPHMSVYDNMAFGLKLRKFAKAEIHERVMEAADILGIAEYLDRKPKALSGGQRQRVAVGRAIVRKPKAFLFDEPLSNLDAKMRVQMRAEIGKLHSRLQSTMIYVTHDQIEAMTMGDRIVVMKDGWIQQVDTPLNIYNRPANQFVAGFIGSPPMNFFPGKILRRPNQILFDEGSFQVAIPEPAAGALAAHDGAEVVMGVRPENVDERGSRPEAHPSRVVKAKVEVVEMMGAEVYLYANTGRNGFTARVSPTCATRVGDSMEALLDMDKAHFFAGADGRVLA